jgi:hypothetical protein
MSKTGKPKSAPHVGIPPKNKPFSFFREKPAVSKGKSAQAPITRKKLSK